MPVLLTMYIVPWMPKRWCQRTQITSILAHLKTLYCRFFFFNYAGRWWDWVWCCSITWACYATTGWWMRMEHWQGKLKCWERNLSINSTWTEMGLSPGLCCQKLVTKWQNCDMSHTIGLVAWWLKFFSPRPQVGSSLWVCQSGRTRLEHGRWRLHSQTSHAHRSRWGLV